MNAVWKLITVTDNLIDPHRYSIGILMRVYNLDRVAECPIVGAVEKFQ